MVKCGFCGQKFNALERLHDKPLSRPPARVAADNDTGGNPAAEPEFVIPEPDAGSVAREVDTEAATRANAAATADEAVARVGKTAAEPESEKQTPAGRLATAFTAGKHYSEYVVNEAILEQAQQQKPGWFRRLFWGFGVLLMLVFAASQTVWFNRDRIMTRYPETISWYGRLCEKFDCQVIRHHDPGAIVLLNRDVRAHPRYKNALLVNATMSNRSQTIQAYPIVQLNLYDTNGNLIAYRQFKPREYLDDSINILRGMAPNVPVHFVLEVLDSVKGAVSFEFEFH